MARCGVVRAKKARDSEHWEFVVSQGLLQSGHGEGLSGDSMLCANALAAVNTDVQDSRRVVSVWRSTQVCLSQGRLPRGSDKLRC